MTTEIKGCQYIKAWYSMPDDWYPYFTWTPETVYIAWLDNPKLDLTINVATGQMANLP